MSAARMLLLGLALAAAGRAAAATPPPPAVAPRTVTIEEAVALARAHAVGSRLAAEEVRRVDGLLVQTRSGSLPAVGVALSATELDGSRVSGNTVVIPGRQTQAAVSGALTLSPSRWYQWSHAGDALDATRAGQQDALRSAALTAARAYLSVIGQRRVVEVSRRGVDTARAHYDFARTRREAGVGNTLDELRAEQQLASAAAQLEGALTGLARTQEALGQATGDDAPLDAVVDPDLSPPAAEPPDEAAARRADVRAAGARAQAAARVADDAWAEWLPSLLATGQAYKQDWKNSTTPSEGWQLQAVLSIPIFEGGLRVGQQRERSALKAEATELLDGLLRQARSEVRAAWASLEHAEAGLRESRRAAEAADRTLALVIEAYKAGAANSLDVTDAEQRARDAETAAAVAEDGVRQARLDLLAATGRFQ